MAALQYVHVPKYAALILMKTYADLSLPDAGIRRAMEWLGGTDARPIDGGKAWRFPSGASLTFGYLDKVGDEQRYRTSQFQYIAFDELTRFPEMPYRFLFRSLRGPKEGPLSAVPLRMRAATNPGDKYGEWVKDRFVPDDYMLAKVDERFSRSWWKEDRLFVPARRHDNPTLDQEDYGRKLAKLLPVQRAQQDEGDWGAHEDGHFKQPWFRSYKTLPDAFLLYPGNELVHRRDCFVVASGDLAGGTSEGAAYTCYPFAAVTPRGQVLILDVIRERLAVEHVIPRLADACLAWRPLWVALEDAFLQSAYLREAAGTFGIPSIERCDPGRVGSKLVRATPAILAAERGRIYLPAEPRPWLEAFRSELCSFTGDPTRDAYDDQVDALAWLIITIDRRGVGRRDDGPSVMGPVRGGGRRS